MSEVLAQLAATIDARAGSDAAQSYTKSLLDGGAEECAKKFGEEASELIIAAVSQDSRALTAEAADVLFHLLVVLRQRGVAFDDVLKELESRMGTSGHDEKAARGQ